MNKILKVSSLLILGLLLALNVASASQVTLTFNNALGAAYPGTSDLTYPYDFNIDGDPGHSLMCIDFNNHISNGQSWQADVSLITTNDPLVFQQAAYLFLQVLNFGADSVDANGAIWNLLDGNTAPTPTPGTLAMLAALPGTFTPNQIAGVVLYTPVNFDLNSPQRFLGTTPEPGTLVMLGSGILGLAGIMRRKLKA